MYTIGLCRLNNRDSVIISSELTCSQKERNTESCNDSESDGIVGILYNPRSPIIIFLGYIPTLSPSKMSFQALGLGQSRPMSPRVVILLTFTACSLSAEKHPGWPGPKFSWHQVQCQPCRTVLLTAPHTSALSHIPNCTGLGHEIPYFWLCVLSPTRFLRSRTMYLKKHLLLHVDSILCS